MLRINEIRIPIDALWEYQHCDNAETALSEAELALLRKKTAKLLKIREEGIRKLKIRRRSIDAREKSRILFVYLLDVKLRDSITGPDQNTEAAFVKALRNRNVTVETEIPLEIKPAEKDVLSYFQKRGERPVVIGSGPCGLFAAHALAHAGLRPLVIERGASVEKRREAVERFFETGKLDPNTNVQFGEGGAGTFSDGKLNTSVKGQGSYIRYVLQLFHHFGAGEAILSDQKPHIGTDVLQTVVKRMREDIRKAGGEFLFETKLIGIETEGGNLRRIRLELPRERRARREAEDVLFRTGLTAPSKEDEGSGTPGLVSIPSSRLILAIGHSARDTLRTLYEQGLSMEQKPFAMGVRIQHPQSLIDGALYGTDRLSEKQQILGPAAYKLTHRCANGRSIYSFCMCPGGYVINASSEEGRLCVNGMSNEARDGETANAALIVNIRTEDFPSEHPLSGILLQQSFEEKAFSACGGAIPCERFGDFRKGRETEFQAPSFQPGFQGFYAFTDLRKLLPEFMQEALLEGMQAFGRIIPGYDQEDALLSAVESRTSSPVRIPRGEAYEANIRGIYPAGEGAGYAGGITSAAADGLRAAEKLMGMLAEPERTS